MMRVRPIFLPFALALACASTSPKVAAATATIATVRTLDEAISAFVRWREVEEPKLAHAAIDACQAQPTRDAYRGCAHAYLAEHRAGSERAKVAIRAYQDALVLAQGAHAGDVVTPAAAELVQALAAVGITIGGAP